MPTSDRVPENSAAFIETEYLKAAHRVLGCSDLQSLKIGSLKPSGSGPNWEVLGLFPKLRYHPLSAIELIVPLGQKHTLKRGKGRK